MDIQHPKKSPTAEISLEWFNTIAAYGNITPFPWYPYQKLPLEIRVRK